MYITIHVADLPAGPWSAQWWHRGAQIQLSASRAAADGQLERAPPAPAGKEDVHVKESIKDVKYSLIISGIFVNLKP